MNYLETVAYIESLSPTLERPSLARMAAFMPERLGAESNFPVFHVGGTNGKGSTVAILDSLLRQSGLNVGRFTGPHLLRWNERFHFNGTAISDQDFARVATSVRELSQQFASAHPEFGPLTWFEFLTAIAFFYFAEKKVDVAVLEVGLGGRFDATNLVDNVLCSIITNIDLDHTQILGDTEEAIAFEKSGILKAGVPAVTAAKRGALSVLKRRSADVGTTLYVLKDSAGPDTAKLYVTAHSGNDNAFDDSVWSEALSEFSKACRSLILLGQHQQENALLAISAICLARKNDRSFAERLPASALRQDNLSRAFSRVYWPGRLQPVPNLDRVFLDGAHNPAGAVILRSALDRLFPNQNHCFVISCFANNNAKQVLSELVCPGDAVFVSEANTRRASMDKNQLAKLARELGAEAVACQSIPEAFITALERRSGNQLVVATGSFSTVSEIMLSLGWHFVEDGLTAETSTKSSSLKNINRSEAIIDAPQSANSLQPRRKS